MKACWVKLNIRTRGLALKGVWLSLLLLSSTWAMAQDSQPGISHQIKGLSSLAPGMLSLEVWVEGPLEEPLNVKVSDARGVAYTHLLSPSRRSATSLVVPGWMPLTVEVYRQNGELWYQAKQAALLKTNPLKSFIPVETESDKREYFGQLEQRLGVGWLGLIIIGAIVVWASRRMALVKYLVSGVGLLMLVAVAWQADRQGVTLTHFADEKSAFEVYRLSELRRDALELMLSRGAVVLGARPHRVGQVVYDQQRQQISVLGHKKATLWLLAKADKVALIQQSSLGIAYTSQTGPAITTP